MIELPGADHGLGGPDGVGSLLDDLHQVAAAVAAFAAGL